MGVWGVCVPSSMWRAGSEDDGARGRGWMRMDADGAGVVGAMGWLWMGVHCGCYMDARWCGRGDGDEAAGGGPGGLRRAVRLDAAYAPRG